MRRTLAIIGLALAALSLGSGVALAGPGCPDKPGVCAPGGDFPW